MLFKMKQFILEFYISYKIRFSIQNLTDFLVWVTEFVLRTDTDHRIRALLLTV